MNKDKGLEYEPNLVQPLPLTPFVVFERHYLPCVSVTYQVSSPSLAHFVVTRLFLSSFPSHLAVP